MKISGKVTSLIFLGSSSGGMLMPMLLGQIFEYIGSYEIMLALFFITALGLVVLLQLLSTSKRIRVRSRA
jgi:hypothetical protein